MSKKFSITPIDDSKKFEDLAPFLSEEEFDAGLISMLNSALEFTSWKGQFGVDKQSITDLPHIIPMVCKGTKCVYREVCPILRKLKKSDPANFEANASKLEDTGCRVDLIEATKYFINYQRELALEMFQSIDVLTTLDIIRCQILKRRCDWDITLEGCKITELSSMDRYNNPIYNTKEHPLVKTSNELEKRIQANVKALSASRADKQKAEKGKTDFIRELLSGATIIATKPSDSEISDFKKQSALPSVIDVEDK